MTEVAPTANPSASEPTAAAPEGKVNVVSSDGQSFSVPTTVAYHSVTIKHLAEDTDMSSAISLPDITGTTLKIVLDYCASMKQVTVEKDGEKSVEWQGTVSWPYEKKEDQFLLFDLIMAANYLDIKPLLDLISKQIAGMIRGKTVEGIREHFNIVCDFDEAELAQLKEEQKWYEEDK